MSDKFNHHRTRFLEAASMTIAAADLLSATRMDASSTQSAEVNPVLTDVVSPVSTTDNRLYPTTVLAELSALVRRVRAASPDSALADIADVKIGRILARGVGDNSLGQGASGCA
jgi:hypothetical protein